jgi:hypothetical protein
VGKRRTGRIVVPVQRLQPTPAVTMNAPLHRSPSRVSRETTTATVFASRPGWKT